MATRYPKKNYEFVRGNDWVYDRMLFDGLEPEIVAVTIPMTEPEYKALEAIRKMYYDALGDDYTGELPAIVIEGEE